MKLRNYWVAHDCGTVINPMLVNGQIVGGVVHGIGNALFERMVYDRDSGQPPTTNFGEYLMPGALEMPRIHVEHMESPPPINPLGVKGAGEGGDDPRHCLHRVGGRRRVETPWHQNQRLPDESGAPACAHQRTTT